LSVYASKLSGSFISVLSPTIPTAENLSRFTTRTVSGLRSHRIDLQKLPEFLRQIRFHCCTLFLRCNGLRNRGSSSEHAFFVRPLGIAPEDRAPAQIISAFVGLLTPVLAKDSKRLLPGWSSSARNQRQTRPSSDYYPYPLTINIDPYVQ
jgi:hypothetical protein